MFGEFVWWQGVVEDRDDPLFLGRCRVRILGYHTDNKQEGIGIPTEHLPWATPSQPITSAAMSGIGTSPTGMVEGTWIFGFFRDGKNAQEPVMLGTFGGIPEDPSNPKLGFNDPTGTFPRQSELLSKGGTDTNRLATGNSLLPVGEKNGEEAPSLKYKRKSRHKDVPTAIAGILWDYDKNKGTAENTDDSHFYVSTLWNEPNPRYGGVKDSATDYLKSVKAASMYPYNHVRMSESGHVEEWDDTETAERLHRYHRTGTFEEIQPDGTKVTKIVGNEYEVTLGYKDVLISGTCNVTIEGDCRMLYKGNLVQEVEKDYHLHVHGDKRTKIHGNEITEVLADRKVVVNGNCDLKVGYDQIINIGDDRTINIGSVGYKQDNLTPKTGNASETITGNLKEITQGTMTTMVSLNTTLVSASNIDITSIGDMGLSTNSNFNHTVTANSTHKISGNASIDVIGSFKHKITGTTYKQYMSAFHERWDGDKWTHTNANTYARHNTGVDHGCPSDPVRTGAVSCADVEQTGL